MKTEKIDQKEIIIGVSQAIRKHVEDYLKRGDTYIRAWVEEELAAMANLMENAAAMKPVNDAVVNPADYVQVGAFNMCNEQSSWGHAELPMPMGIRGFSIASPSRIGYGQTFYEVHIEPYASGVAATEVARAMSGAGGGLKPGKKYRVLIMAWEQADEKKGG